MILLLYLITLNPYPIVETDPHYCYEVREELLIAIENEVITHKEAEALLSRCPIYN